MLIKNKNQICNEKTKSALEILNAGLISAQPELFLGKFIKKNKILVGTKPYLLSKHNRVFLIAVGKAADSMTRFACTRRKFDGGIVVVPKNYKVKQLGEKMKVIYASHPIPNHSSIRAATSVIKLLQSMTRNDFVIFLISGGASSLLALPNGVTLNQKQQTTNVLLKCGASIEEINAIRKHLSSVKGGQILRHLRCPAVSYVMSDVVGDDLHTIASGLTYCDNTTFSDCLQIVAKYRLKKRLPAATIRHLKHGAAGLIPETPKKPTIPNIIVATNRDCLTLMLSKAKSLGYDAKLLYPLSGPVSIAARQILQNFSFGKKSCLIFGGETTVSVKGDGKGGRNQELVLHVIRKIKRNATVASVGTDGIDGNTMYAGAIFSGIPKHTVDRYLKNNNSNSFFKKYGGLVMTGPTHTNLMDIGLILTE